METPPIVSSQEWEAALAKEGVRNAAANLKLLHDAGVPIVHGSDGPYGFSMLGRPRDELGALAGGGLDAAACLLKDGQLIACAQEERFNRRKSSALRTPCRCGPICRRSCFRLPVPRSPRRCSNA